MKTEYDFKMLYNCYSPQLYSTICRIVKHNDLAQDVLQETFIKIWTKADQFQSEKGDLLGWINTIAKNTALDKIKSVANDRNKCHGFATEYRSSVTELNIDAIKLGNYLQQLPRHLRIIIQLYYYHGFSSREISLRLNLPEGTIKTRIRSALVRLRANFKEKKKVVQLAG